MLRRNICNMQMKETLEKKSIQLSKQMQHPHEDIAARMEH
jgi:hypothetical protein